MIGSKLKNRFELVVIGVSAGGLNALLKILPELDEDFKLPIVIVQHLHPDRVQH